VACRVPNCPPLTDARHPPIWLVPVPRSGSRCVSSRAYGRTTTMLCHPRAVNDSLSLQSRGGDFLRSCGLLLTGGDALRTATKKRLRLWPLWDLWGLRTLAECTAATMFCGAPICLHVVSGDVLVWMGARFPVGLRLWKSRDGRKFPKRAVDKKTRPAHIPRTGAPLVLRLDGAPPKPSLIIRWQSFRPRSAAGGFDAF
jgi:hypothetical protein